ncbi:AAA family ATPase [Ralstonia holmesii]|uniref:AAA family ATPase n=1 Tax=Ralstonia holmesii TaxID=3058602 RepID=UPI003F175031
MIPGGIADKLGNRYEAKWLALKLIEVVLGQASMLCFEGPAEEFAGYEFLLVKGSEKQWHQAKISNTLGNWTTNRLQNLGVLEAFRKRLSLEDATDQCHFVSQDPAVTLRDLTERARTANDYADFQHLLTGKLAEALQEISAAWKTSQEVAYLWLQRVHCRVQPEDELDESIEVFGSLCISLNRTQIFAALRDYLEQRFNKRLTTDMVREELPQAGINLRHWQLDPTLTEHLRSATEDYVNSYPPVSSENLIPRKEVRLLLDELENPHGANTVLLTGGAGSGKSSVVNQLLVELSTRGITHVALRVDEYLEVATKEDIGRRLTQRSESPVVILKGISEAALSVLIIDQVDAISEVSGRNSQLKPQLLRMLSDAERFNTVKVVCVCRAFDLENDVRLKALTSRQSVRRIEISPLDWQSEIEPLLQQRGIDVASLSLRQKKLLEVPLNLGVFLEVHADGRPFTSRNDLFAGLLEKKTRQIANRDRAPKWSVAQPLNALARWMSDRQTLQAPQSTLQDFESAAEILASENLITVRNGKVHLFHESFFDYLFARGFAASPQTLVELLLSDSDQYLFRRTQVRQILESLREDDRRRYLSELECVLTSPKVRYHIKLAVAQWLGALRDPSLAEFTLVRNMDAASASPSLLARSAFQGTPAWFDLVKNTEGFLEGQLNSPVESRRETTLWWLSRVAPERPDEVGKLLDSWRRTGDSSQRAERLLDWFPLMHGQPITGQLLQLCESLMREHPEILLENKNHSRTTTLLECLARSGPTAAVPIIQAYFEAWFEAHKEGHPFSRDESELDLEPLAQLASEHPKAYVEATIRALAVTVVRIRQAQDAENYDGTFLCRRVGDQYSTSDKFLATFREALKSLAKSEPAVAEQFLSQLTPSSHPAVLHLHLEAIAANGIALANHLPQLFEEEHLFDAGWDGAAHQSFADAARAALPHLPVEACQRLEEKVLAYRPELSYARKLLASIRSDGDDGLYRSRGSVLWSLGISGHAEWCIWEAFDTKLFSERARDRLAELRRKFAGCRVPAPREIGAKFVGSPIPPQAITRMSDGHWLQAIRDYADKDRRGERRPLEGGSEQLATHLVQLTKQSPVRFASLLTRIPEDAPASYLRNILLGLSEAEAEGIDSTIARAVLSAHQRAGRPFGSEICHLISKHPKVAEDDAVFDALCWYVEFGTHQQRNTGASNQSSGQPYSIEQLISRGDELHMRGLGGQRGSAISALARVLWQLPHRKPHAWELIQRRVLDEPELEVRCTFVEVLMPMLADNKEACAELLEASVTHASDAVGRNLLVLSSRIGVRLLSYLLYHVPGAAGRLVEHLLASTDEVLRGIGAWQVICASFYEDGYIKAADELIASSDEFRQLAADCAASAVVDGGLTKRALTCIPQYFNDPNKRVRAKAKEVFRSIPADNFAGAIPLCKQFIGSLAFDEQMSAFFSALGHATCDVSDVVISAAEKLVSAVAASGEPYRRASDLHHLQELLKNEYAATEHSPALRKRILDVIDLMLEHGMYGTDEILKAHERD